MAPDVIDDVIRRELLVGGVCLAPDCGNESNPTPPAGATAQSSDFPVTVAPTYCSTTIQRAPERIVTVGLAPGTEPAS